MPTLVEIIESIVDLHEKQEIISFGDENAVVEHKGVSRPSVAKSIKDQYSALAGMMQGRKSFKTYDELMAYTPTADADGHYTLAEVFYDPDPDKNGLYGWKQFIWLKSELSENYYRSASTVDHAAEMAAIAASAAVGRNGPLIGWTIKPGSTGFEIDITGGVDVDGDRSNLLDSTITVQAGDKYVYYDVANGCASYTTEQPDKILLAKLGYVYNPYEPERHRTIEGIPSDWDTKKRHSWIWKSPAVDDADARLALYRFHNGLEDIAYPNDPRRGCTIDESLLRDNAYADTLNAIVDVNNERLIVGDVGDDLFGIKLDDLHLDLGGGSEALLIDQMYIVFNRDTDLPFYLIRQKGGGGSYPDVKIINTTLEQGRDAAIKCEGIPNISLIKNVLIKKVGADGIKPENNIIFDLIEIYDTATGAGSHSDGYQWSGSDTEGVKGFNVVTRNCIWMPHPDCLNESLQPGSNNACVYFDPDWGPCVGQVAIQDVTIEKSILNGSGFTVYCIGESGQGYLTRDIKIKNNWFGLDYGWGFARDVATDGGISSHGDGISVWENNRRIDSGELIPKPVPES